MKTKNPSIEERFLQYKELDRQIKALNDKAQELDHQKCEIFLSKYKTMGIYSNASAIFVSFFKNPTVVRTRAEIYFDVEAGNNGLYFSRESLNSQLNRILKDFVEQEFIIKPKQGLYKLNPKIERLLNDKRTVSN